MQYLIQRFNPPFEDRTFLDFGCGYGFDADEVGADKYDIHFFPDKPEGRYRIITCIYVLNTLGEELQEPILEDILGMLELDGFAYVVVRRDHFKEGLTSTGTYQRKVVLPASWTETTDIGPFRAEIRPIYKKGGQYEIYQLRHCQKHR